MKALSEQEVTAMARRIIDASSYMTLATADEQGRPWATPVWYAPETYTALLWVSRPETRHSRNLSIRAELAIVIYDSTAPIGSAEAVYMEAVAEQLTGVDLETAIQVFSRRSQEHGAPEWTAGDVLPPAEFRLYRAVVSTQFVLDPNVDRRLPVVPG
jgi:uncharacterized protein YhbP (UPF0306 family)